uniref:DUF3108 domain-containing protein n=1 Tax=Eiseniibacteriota bacterium TaxID=2212470 RepID=A0A832MIV4_UNCEI
MTPRPARCAALAAAVLLLAAAPAVAARPYAGAQFRYWSFSHHNDLRDVLAYWVPGPFHVQLEYWDFVRGEDQFRPEVGLHLRDRRRSTYTVQWRHERFAERFWFETEQVLSERWVGRAGVSPIVTEDSTDVVLYAGADVYWGSYSFASANVIRDPRGDDLWVVPLRVRLANEANDWLQLTLAPASERTLGWAADAKIRWLRLGVERNSRYDFTSLDNVVVTAGVEVPLAPAP